LVKYAVTHWSQCRTVNRMFRLCLPTHLCGAGNIRRIWSTCREHEIQYTEWSL